MRFLIIDPAARVTLLEDHPNFESARKSAGLDALKTDHGNVGDHVSVCVYEYGLFKPTDAAAYFTINGHLCEGHAVVYAYDAAGKTIDIPSEVETWVTFRTADEVTAEIIGGRIRRPTMAVNGKVLWQWPQRPPSGFPEAAYTAGRRDPAVSP